MKGKKIILLPLEHDDLERSRRWVNDEELKSQILRIIPVASADQENWYMAIARDPSKTVFAIRSLQENKHIGNTGFYHIDWIHRRAEFWILIGDKSFQGKKIGSEVLSLMLDYAFFGLNLNRVYLYVGCDNTRAVQLYEKMNFKKEGILRDHYYINGKYLDVAVMGILKDDYQSLERDKNEKRH